MNALKNNRYEGFFILSGLKKIMQAQFTIVNLLRNIFYGAKKYRANYLLYFRTPCILFFLQKNVNPMFWFT